MTDRIFTTCFTLALAMAMTCSAFAGSITLRSAVRLAPDATKVYLADIADLSGEDAKRFSDLLIAELSDPTAAVEISLRQVRAKLDDAGVHWGRTTLSGRSVTVRPRRSGDTGPPLAMSGAAINGGSVERREEKRERPQHRLASELAKQRTLRGMIATYIANRLDADPNDVQLSFDERHADFLDASPGEQQFELEPVSNIRSSRIDLTVRVWVDGLIDHRRTISVSPLVRTPVLMVRDEIRRNEVIEERALHVDHQWMSPGTNGVVQDAASVVGRHAQTRLREGDMLREHHLRREMLVRRGEHVIVRCLVGSTVIAMQAEARADAGEGDTIEFRKLGERETFLAVVTGPNEAIVNLSR